jgi:hypothetical protein
LGRFALHVVVRLFANQLPLPKDASQSGFSAERGNMERGYHACCLAVGSTHIISHCASPSVAVASFYLKAPSYPRQAAIGLDPYISMSKDQLYYKEYQNFECAALLGFHASAVDHAGQFWQVSTQDFQASLPALQYLV